VDVDVNEYRSQFTKQQAKLLAVLRRNRSFDSNRGFGVKRVSRGCVLRSESWNLGFLHIRVLAMGGNERTHSLPAFVHCSLPIKCDIIISWFLGKL
jgi:hypothetical protein